MKEKTVRKGREGSEGKDSEKREVSNGSIRKTSYTIIKNFHDRFS